MTPEAAEELLDFLRVPQWGRKAQGENIMSFCPLHDDQKQSFGIHPEKEVAQCYVCGGFSIPKLINEVMGLGNLAEAHEIFRVKFGGGVLSNEQILDRIHKRELPKPDPKYLTETQLEVLPYAAELLADRGLTPATVRRFGLRYHQRLSSIVCPAYTYPDREYAGHSARVLGNPRIRCGNPQGFDRSNLLFGLWETGLGEAWIRGKDNHVVVVEGPLDAAWVFQETGRFVVGLFGSKLSLAQARLLRRSTGITLFLDNDWAGLRGLWRAYKLLARSVRLWVAPYPPGAWEADPNDLDPSDLLWGLEHAQRAIPSVLWKLSPKNS